MRKINIPEGFYWAMSKATLEKVVVEYKDEEFFITDAKGPCSTRDFFYEYFIDLTPLKPPEEDRRFREMWEPEGK